MAIMGHKIVKNAMLHVKLVQDLPPPTALPATMFIITTRLPPSSALPAML